MGTNIEGFVCGQNILYHQLLTPNRLKPLWHKGFGQRLCKLKTIENVIDTAVMQCQQGF
jgi:hypothetical protein